MTDEQPGNDRGVEPAAMHVTGSTRPLAASEADLDAAQETGASESYDLSRLPREERDLMLRARAGDIEAAKSLLTRHRDALYAIAWGYLLDREEALDAVQESLAKALAHIRGYDPRRPVSAWLARITRNTCLDRLRRLSHRRHASLEERREAGLPDPRSARPSPESDVLRYELREHLRAAVATLRPIEQEVIILRDVLEWTYEEIEKYLGLTHGTVASLIHRARARLRDQLSPYVRRTSREDDTHGS
ncbi:MAG: sigma-70 family RNA polymerase sigma factor [Acidobacteria bacterium]|nr:sigma-70 family RNA polymerase sigma factor [Acidobacteriota bacterium]